MKRKKRYTTGFKRQVVLEVLSGKITKEGARLRYEIGGNSTVLDWMRVYAGYKAKQTGVDPLLNLQDMQEDQEKACLKEEIERLQAELKYTKLKDRAYQIMVELAKEDYGLDLEKDLEDIKLNVGGHKSGLAACNYFRKAVMGKAIEDSSLKQQYHYLTRDFISIQNVAGYETLKSKGLELVGNDSLRLKIIGLYEYDYNILRKLEEEYDEMQFQKNYFKELNDILAPHFNFDSTGAVSGIELPLTIDEIQKKKSLLYLWKIQSNRDFILKYYQEVEKSIKEVRNQIRKEITSG